MDMHMDVKFSYTRQPCRLCPSNAQNHMINTSTFTYLSGAAAIVGASRCVIVYGTLGQAEAAGRATPTSRIISMAPAAPAAGRES